MLLEDMPESATTQRAKLEATLAAARAAVNGGAAAPDDTGRARIRVVDDVAENRDVLCRRLERAGHQVTAAEHGRRALELLGERPFDLVLLDVMMPELDGYGVLEA